MYPNRHLLQAMSLWRASVT